MPKNSKQQARLDLRLRLMQSQTSLPKQIAITVAIMLMLIVLVYLGNIPNPNMILIVGLVLCSALFGYGGGAVAAAIMFLYTLFFFSVDHSFVVFNVEGLQKVLVSLLGIVVNTLLVCGVKRAETQAFRNFDSLTEDLHREYMELQNVSHTDGLTQIRNRTALQMDSVSYLRHEVTVMMIDLNDFKIINDTYGHEEGDRILKETAQLLANAFGLAHCYRYGGDEFLVILPDVPMYEFLKCLAEVYEARPQVETDGETSFVSFSVGHVHARPDNLEELHVLIAEADERMYEQKRDRRRAKSDRTAREQSEPLDEPTQLTEYTIKEMEDYLTRMSGSYDLARMVDPVECRVLEIQSDGTVRRSKKCYGVWSAGQRCVDCSSAVACKTGCRQRKSERVDDTVYHFESTPIKLTLQDGTSYDAVVELGNVTKTKVGDSANNREAENVNQRALKYRAHHDSLTGVLNSDAFHELARERVTEGSDASWLMATTDIRDFRVVNSLFGVPRGNEVLVRTASLLNQIAADTDGLCGRLGEDRFALLARKARFEEQSLQNVALDLAQGFADGAYKPCIHFGIYHIEDASLPVSVMCGRANSALFTIHESDTQTIAYFDEDIRQKILLEQRIISGFDMALDGGEFQIYLQPIVHSNGHIVGAEALARWQKPDGTLVLPGDFIETLECANLIQRLDMHIWELAVRQLSAWKGTEWGNLPISVNMSAKDFYGVDVCGALMELTRRYKVDSHLIRVQITETALLVEPEKGNEVVAKLRNEGFLVEIDGFGKGYSSLSILKSVRADVLKIDVSLVHEVNDCSRSKTVLQSIIDMAQSLQMDVICEGVETGQQLEMLTSMGCDLFQGFYFSRPVPVKKFETVPVSAW